MSALRPHQVFAVRSLAAALRNDRKAPVLVMPTGSGKTRVAGEICMLANRNPAGRHRWLFIAPRRKLVLQTAKAFRALGMHVGLIMAGHGRRDTVDCYVGSLYTLLAMLKRGEPMPDISGVMFDEAHEATMGAIKDLKEAFAKVGVPCIGLTATPARGDGRGLGEVFDDMIVASSVAALTPQYLVPVQYFAPSAPDMKGVKKIGLEYNAKQAGKRMEPLIGDIVENWQRIAPGKRTVVFTVTVANAVSVCEEFCKVGVRAEWVCGDTPEDEQEKIFARLESGETTVLCNAQLLSYGWDCPAVEVCIIAKPTNSVANLLQMGGRVLRIFPGKIEAILIDHAGVIDKLGYLDDDFEWTLDGKEFAATNKTRQLSKDSGQMTCRVCKHVHKPQAVCPNCGAKPIQKVDAPEVIAAQLEEKKKQEAKDKKKLKKEMSQSEKDRFYGELIGHCREKGYKDGAAYYMYQERLGSFPSRKAPAVPPSDETRAWLRHRAIKRAKAKEAAERKVEG